MRKSECGTGGTEGRGNGCGGKPNLNERDYDFEELEIYKLARALRKNSIGWQGTCLRKKNSF